MFLYMVRESYLCCEQQQQYILIKFKNIFKSHLIAAFTGSLDLFHVLDILQMSWNFFSTPIYSASLSLHL